MNYAARKAEARRLPGHAADADAYFNQHNAADAAAYFNPATTTATINAGSGTGLMYNTVATSTANSYRASDL